MPDESGESVNDRSDEKLTPKEAYTLTVDNGMKGVTVAKMFDVTPAYVSQRKSQYEEAKNDGVESVTPDRFEEEELRDALEDKPPEDNPYETTMCPRCSGEIMETEKPNEAGNHPCPLCGEVIQWDEGEL